MIYARKIDATHRSIRDALRKAGYAVEDTSRVGGGFFDLIATKHHRAFFIECKSDKKVRRNRREGLSEAQVDFMARWQGPSIIVTESPEDALWQVKMQTKLYQAI